MLIPSLNMLRLPSAAAALYSAHCLGASCYVLYCTASGSWGVEASSLRFGFVYFGPRAFLNLFYYCGEKLRVCHAILLILRIVKLKI